MAIVLAALIGGLALGARAEQLAFAGARPALCGDCNNDGRVDVLDALRAAQHLLAPTEAASPLIGHRSHAACDMNSDRRIDMIDVMRLAQANSEERGREDLLCALERVELPIAITGIAYDAPLPIVAPLTGEWAVALHGELPDGLEFHEDPYRIAGVPTGANSRSFEIETLSPGAPARTLAVELEVLTLAPPIDVRTASASGDAVATTLVTIPNAGIADFDIQAIVATPPSWRENGPSVLLLVAIRDEILAVVVPERPTPAGEIGGMLAPIRFPGSGALVTGLVFAGEHCYAIDQRGAFARIDRHAGGGHTFVPLGAFEALAGATALAVEMHGAEPEALIVTLRDVESHRLVARVPMALADPELHGETSASETRSSSPTRLAREIAIVDGPSGAAFGAAFVNLEQSPPTSGQSSQVVISESEAKASLSLIIRRQPDQLSLVSFEAGSTSSRIAMPAGSLPRAGGLDSLVAVSRKNALVFSAGDRSPAGTVGFIVPEMRKDPTGVWYLPLESGALAHRIVGDFSPLQPAGALSIGKSSVGTGQSLFVAGNGKIYEIFGLAGSETFGF